MYTNCKKNYSVPVALVSVIPAEDILTASNPGEDELDIRVSALEKWFN